MSSILPQGTDSNPPPPLKRVACPTCRAPMGAPCSTTTTGRLVPSGHRLRWDRYRREMRARFSRWFLLKDDERFGLTAGDVLIGRPYWLDPDKVTVERRESDGFDPRCNQYGTDLRWIGWVA